MYKTVVIFELSVKSSIHWYPQTIKIFQNHIFQFLPYFWKEPYKTVIIFELSVKFSIHRYLQKQKK